jgi:nucleotide-binding universal stress UspA family protein
MMKKQRRRYSKVIVPLDGSELAAAIIPYARYLAQQLNLPLKLLRIVAPERVPAGPPPRLGSGDNAEQVFRDYEQVVSEARLRHAEAYLEQLTSSWFGDDYTGVSSSVYFGSPAAGILSVADEDPRALLALSSHGRSGISRWLLGGTADKVVQASRNPTLVYHPRGESPEPDGVMLNDIIVPLNTKKHAEAALAHARYLAANIANARIVLLTVIPSTWGIGIPFTELGEDHASWLDPASLERTVRGYLLEVKKQLSGRVDATVSIKVLHGNPAKKIASYANRQVNSVIVACFSTDSGLKQKVIGDTPSGVVRFSTAPVLLVHR